MKTTCKKYGCLLTVILIALSACGITACGNSGVTSKKAPDSNSTEEGVAKGRYIEKEWEMPTLPTGKAAASVETITRDGNKFIVIFSDEERNNLYSYSTEDGENWVSMDELALVPLGFVEGEIRLGVPYRNEEGAYYTFLTEDEYQSSILRKIEADGTKVPIPIDWKGRNSLNADGIKTDESGNLYFIVDQKLCQYTQDGKQILEYQNAGKIQTFAIDKDKVAVYSETDKKIIVMNIKTGDLIEQIPIDSNMVLERDYPQIDFDEQGNLYLCSKAGIFCLTNNGALFEKIFDGAAGSIGMPAFYMGGICAASDRILLSMGNGSGDNKILEYSYNAEIPLQPDRTLNVATINNNETVNQAVRQYQINNPDVAIIVTQLFDNNSPMTNADAIRTLNTDILSGNGPDVLILDGMPIDSYIEKGILRDITEPVEKMITEEGLYPAIAGAFQKENGLYAVPAKFRVPILVAEPDNLPKAVSLHALAEMVRQNPEQRIFYNILPEALMKQFFDTCSLSWKKGSGEIDQTAYAEFLADIKTLSENTYGPDLAEDIQAVLEDRTGTAEEKGEIAESLAAVRTGFGKSMYCPQTIKGMDSFMFTNGLSNQLLGESYQPENATNCFMPMPGQMEDTKKFFIPSAIMGISTKSEQPELAEDFVKTALSKEVQKYVLNDGMPVNAEAVETMYAVMDAFSSEDAPDGDSYAVEYPSVEAQKALVEFVGTFDTPVIADEDYYKIAVEESQAFFAGEATAEEAAAAFTSRAKAYLSE